jgi:hypothetical protein
MKIWILAIVVCAGVQQICSPLYKEPLEFLTYSECTKMAYRESINILFEGDYTLEQVENNRLFTKWSCIPVFKPGQPT